MSEYAIAGLAHAAGEEPADDGILRICLICGGPIIEGERAHVYSLDPLCDVIVKGHDLIGENPGYLCFIHAQTCQGVTECRCTQRGK